MLFEKRIVRPYLPIPAPIVQRILRFFLELWPKGPGETSRKLRDKFARPEIKRGRDVARENRSVLCATDARRRTAFFRRVLYVSAAALFWRRSRRVRRRRGGRPIKFANERDVRIRARIITIYTFVYYRAACHGRRGLVHIRRRP